MSIGKRMNLIRRDVGLSGAEFGLRLGGIGKAMISNYEKDRNMPSALVIKKICLEFGVNGHWLLTGQGKRYVEDKPILMSEMREDLLNQKTIEERLTEIEREIKKIKEKNN